MTTLLLRLKYACLACAVFITSMMVTANTALAESKSFGSCTASGVTAATNYNQQIGTIHSFTQQINSGCSWLQVAARKWYNGSKVTYITEAGSFAENTTGNAPMNFHVTKHTKWYINGGANVRGTVYTSHDGNYSSCSWYTSGTSGGPCNP